MLCVCLALGAVCLLASCSRQTVLVAGIDISQVPISYESGGDATGFMVDMATEVAKRAGMTVRFVPIDWDDKEKAFASGAVNSVWGELEPGDRDAANMLLTKCYMKNDQDLLVPRKSTIKTKSDLKGCALGAMKGSSAALAFAGDSIASTLEGGALNDYVDFETLFLALDSDQLDAVAVDRTMGDYYMMSHAGQYRLLNQPIDSEQYAVGVRRNDSELRNALQKALDQMAADGTSARLSQKWFGENLTLK